MLHKARSEVYALLQAIMSSVDGPSKLMRHVASEHECGVIAHNHVCSVQQGKGTTVMAFIVGKDN